MLSGSRSCVSKPLPMPTSRAWRRAFGKTHQIFLLVVLIHVSVERLERNAELRQLSLQHGPEFVWRVQTYLVEELRVQRLRRMRLDRKLARVRRRHPVGANYHALNEKVAALKAEYFPSETTAAVRGPKRQRKTKD